MKYDLVFKAAYLIQMKRIFDLDQSSSHSAKLRINYRCGFLRRGGNYPRIAFEEMLQDRFITIYSTTSPQDSGLFGYLLPIFQAATKLKVGVAAVGTGEALALGRRGYADAPAEDKFVADGYGVDRRDVMYDDFVIVGPSHDPAHIRGLKDIRMASARIAAARVPFASRGDDSGTARMEIRLWELADKIELRLWKAWGVEPDHHDAGWYRPVISKEGTALLNFDRAEGWRVFH